MKHSARTSYIQDTHQAELILVLVKANSEMVVLGNDMLPPPPISSFHKNSLHALGTTM
jgi:hypothetical protein